MSDIIFLVLVLAFFVGGFFYVRGCARVVETGEPAPPGDPAAERVGG